MKTRRAGRAQWIGVATLVFSLVFFACGAALASEVERQIPVLRDSAGSGLTMEISREGSRQSATPFIRLNEPTVHRIEDRIAMKTGQFSAKNPVSGAPREGAGRPENRIPSIPQPPQEITARTVKGFLKELRASRKAKPTPAVAVAAPEERIGTTGTSLGETN